MDALCARMVTHPQTLDVIVASNLFGDILTDIGSAISGSLGVAPGGNINPDRTTPSMFEPIHGSAPDIAGKGIANPIAAIWAGAMMLDHLGEHDAYDRILRAIEAVICRRARADARPRRQGHDRRNDSRRHQRADPGRETAGVTEISKPEVAGMLADIRASWPVTSATSRLLVRTYGGKPTASLTAAYSG